MGRHLIGRIVVFSVNFALWGSGILLIVFGSIGISSDTAAVNMLTGISPGVVENVVNIVNVVPYLQGVGIFMIILGCFLFLLGGNGCHGIMRKSKKSTMMYFIWLLCAILVELALIIYAGVYPTTTQTPIENEMTTNLNQSFENAIVLPANGTIVYSSDITTSSWQKLEFDSRCCGARGKQDYFGDNTRINPGWTYQYNLTDGPVNAQVPITCCTPKSGVGVPTNIDQLENVNNCLRNNSLPLPPDEGFYNNQGCGKQVNAMVYQFNLIAIIISSCLIGAQIVGVIFAARIWKDTD